MQIFSSVAQDEAHLIHDKAKAYLKEGQEVPRTQEDYFDFNFGYNIFAHYESVLAGAGAEAERVRGRGEDGEGEVSGDVLRSHADELDADAGTDMDVERDCNLTTSPRSDASRIEEEALALAAAADKDGYERFVTSRLWKGDGLRSLLDLPPPYLHRT